MFFRRLLYVSLLFGCTSCALFGGDHFSAREITYEQLSGWTDDNQSEALSAFIASCPSLARKARPVSTGSGLEVPAAVWKSLCDEAQVIPLNNKVEARQFFEKRFVPFRVANNGKETGLFTGYYEPVLYGSKKKTGDYIYPLYLPPPELKNSKPYLTHAQINAGALDKRHLELVWVDDPVMRFFLQIQGSGHVRLTDGSKILVGYADQNGHPYTGLGKVMEDEGLLPKDQINFFTIRQWLYDHPDQAFDLMERNPSYVFFRKMDSTGPVGAVGAVLTPQRSLAVDSGYIPYGLPLFIETQLPPLPPPQPNTPKPFNRTLVAQDTGGAIRGPVRGDIFFGPGGEAEYLAGYMKGHGVYSLLVPAEIAYTLR